MHIGRSAGSGIVHLQSIFAVMGSKFSGAHTGIIGVGGAPPITAEVGAALILKAMGLEPEPEKAGSVPELR